MTVFRYALARHGREVKFYRHGEAEPYHVSKALMGPIGSGTAVGAGDARGSAAAARRVLWFPAGEVFPRPTDGYIEVDGVRLVIERADSPTVPTACRAVARELDAWRNFGTPKPATDNSGEAGLSATSALQRSHQAASLQPDGSPGAVADGDIDGASGATSAAADGYSSEVSV